MSDENENAPSVDAVTQDAAPGDKPKQTRTRKPKDAAPGDKPPADKTPTGGVIPTPPEVPPWGGFAEAPPSNAFAIPPDGVEAARAKRRDGLILAEGYSYYYCTRNCGNGRYISGKTYPLKDDPAPIATCFRKI